MNEDPAEDPISAEDPFEGDRAALFPKPDLVLPRMPDDELRKFIQDMLANQIFLSDQIRRPEDTGMVFMPLLMGALGDYDPKSFDVIGVFYEYHSKSLPRSINGYPCFASVRMLHRLDWLRAKKAIIAEQERLKDIPLPPDELAREFRVVLVEETVVRRPSNDRWLWDLRPTQLEAGQGYPRERLVVRRADHVSLQGWGREAQRSQPGGHKREGLEIDHVAFGEPLVGEGHTLLLRRYPHEPDRSAPDRNALVLDDSQKDIEFLDVKEVTDLEPPEALRDDVPTLVRHHAETDLASGYPFNVVRPYEIGVKRIRPPSVDLNEGCWRLVAPIVPPSNPIAPDVHTSLRLVGGPEGREEHRDWVQVVPGDSQERDGSLDGDREVTGCRSTTGADLDDGPERPVLDASEERTGEHPVR